LEVTERPCQGVEFTCLGRHTTNKSLSTQQWTLGFIEGGEIVKKPSDQCTGRNSFTFIYVGDIRLLMHSLSL
jgi:hypothetical protein